MSEVVGWFTLAFINVAIAQSKNRPSWGWFFTSLIIGPLATLLLVTLCRQTLKKDPWE